MQEFRKHTSQKLFKEIIEEIVITIRKLKDVGRSRGGR